MDKKGIITFAMSVVGASHLPKGVPCQDYSVSWESEDGQKRIIIVCDGHGSSTYVRSDVGSKLAAEISKEALIKFVSETDPMLFINHKGVVTARPSLDENKWVVNPNKSEALMTESELLQHKQNLLFCLQVNEVKEQDPILCGLFESIYNQWLEAIKNDSQEHPFSESEKNAIGQNDIVKAYGTTLMAFVRTPFYWLSFHIGDGRIVIADKSLKWNQPVPWDCNCFQNFTTSLCNTNPLKSFRYAFDGTGFFPSAVMCCSDGIEDSYGDFDIAPHYLHNFYNGLLNSFLTEGKDITLEKLKEFLPKLSAIGSKDDMSLAAIINLDSIENGLKGSDILKQRDLLNAQHAERVKNQQAAEAELERSKKELEGFKQDLLKIEQKKNTLLDRIKELIHQEESLRSEATQESSNIVECQNQIDLLTESISKMQIDLNEEVERNQSEDENARTLKAELKHQYDELEVIISQQNEAELSDWQKMVLDYIAASKSTQTEQELKQEDLEQDDKQV